MTVSELITKLQQLISDEQLSPDYKIAVWIDQRVGKEAFDIIDIYDIDHECEYISFNHN